MIRVFTKFFKPSDFLDKLSHLEHLNISLFIDEIPSNRNDLSEINILVLAEPNEYFGLHDWAIQNKDLFQLILTWDSKVMAHCDNARFLAFGSSWFKPDQYEEPKPKKCQVSHLCGTLLKSYGHQMRHEILARETEFHIPTNFHKTIGNRHDLEDARKGKEIVFGESQFGIAIENFSHNGYFSEKLIDLFLLRTIPIYNGCSDIGNYFNTDSIIKFENVDHLISICNNLNQFSHITYGSAIEENYNTALHYIDYQKRIIVAVEDVLKLNDLI